jgi:hypothetical protein
MRLCVHANSPTPPQWNFTCASRALSQATQCSSPDGHSRHLLPTHQPCDRTPTVRQGKPVLQRAGAAHAAGAQAHSRPRRKCAAACGARWIRRRSRLEFLVLACVYHTGLMSTGTVNSTEVLNRSPKVFERNVVNSAVATDTAITDSAWLHEACVVQHWKTVNSCRHCQLGLFGVPWRSRMTAARHSSGAKRRVVGLGSRLGLGPCYRVGGSIGH